MVMWVTTDDAVEMYARFCEARYGEKAQLVVAERAAELRRSGDVEGEQIWTKVKRRIEARTN